MKSDVTLRLHSVSDKYINFLRQDPKLSRVFDSKENERSHTRKYLGAVFTKNDHSYYIPFSSPKDSDYCKSKDGNFVLNDYGDKIIRKSITPIIRMVSNNSVSGKPELKGTLKISSMIPVPQSELTPYDIASEKDANYKMIVTKEYDFIKSNSKLILRNANNLYNEKTNEDIIFSNKTKPNYLKSAIDFDYAEEKCAEYCKTYSTETSQLDNEVDKQNCQNKEFMQ
jgi:protein AbiQ